MQTYPNKAAAVEALNEENCWSYYYENYSSDGRRVSYRCNAIKFRASKQCDAKAYLLYHSKDTTVSFYRSTSGHSHDEAEIAESLVFRFSPEAVACITDMYNNKMKPKSIKLALVTKGFGVPPKAKLDSFLKKLRAAKLGKDKLHLGTLEAWLIDCSSEPADDKDAFIVNYQIDSYDDDEPKFRFDTSIRDIIFEHLVYFSNSIFQIFRIEQIAFESAYKKYIATQLIN